MAQVDDHPRVGIDGAANRDLDDVAVTVFVHILAERGPVLLVAPLRPAENVRGGERGAPGDAHAGGHGSMRKLAPDSGADSGDASQTMMRATSAGSAPGLRRRRSGASR